MSILIVLIIVRMLFREDFTVQIQVSYLSYVGYRKPFEFIVLLLIFTGNSATATKKEATRDEWFFHK